MARESRGVEGLVCGSLTEDSVMQMVQMAMISKDNGFSWLILQELYRVITGFLEDQAPLNHQITLSSTELRVFSPMAGRTKYLPARLNPLPQC